LLSGRLNTENLRIYFCANPKSRVNVGGVHGSIVK
jgi:hypothetical protein